MSTATHLTGVGAGPGNWRTPEWLYERLNRIWQFDYDAFASHENALTAVRRDGGHAPGYARYYSTVEGTWREYDGRYTGESYETGCEFVSRMDGLTFPWESRRVFMNPPYGRGILAQSMEKAASECDNAAVIVALIPANTDTGWWHDFVKPYASVHLLRGRVQFLDPETGKPGGSPPGGSAIAVYLPEFLR